MRVETGIKMEQLSSGLGGDKEGEVSDGGVIVRLSTEAMCDNPLDEHLRSME